MCSVDKIMRWGWSNLFNQLGLGLFMASLCLSARVSGVENEVEKFEKVKGTPEKGHASESSVWNREHVTGSWGGARDWASKRGLEFDLVYTGEVMGNTMGGRNTNKAIEYVGALDATFELNVEKMGGWNDGTFFFWIENLHGEGLTEEHVQDFQTLSNLEEASFTTLYEYWYKHEWWDGKLWVKAGKIDANGDFATTDFGGEFIQSSFGFPPQIPFGTFPDSGLAVQLGYKINSWAYIQAMYQDGAPEGKSIGGLKTMFDGEGGHIGLFEFHFSPPWLPTQLPGTYRFGGWHHTGDVEEISVKAVPPEVSSNYGLYFILDQMVFKENDAEDDEQGLGVFFQYSWAPLDRNEVEHYVGGGWVYRGLFPGRKNDVTGGGVAHARFSDRLKSSAGLRNETAIEFFYRFQVTPFLSLQPQMQFIKNPGGIERDALVAGLRFEVNF